MGWLPDIPSKHSGRQPFACRDALRRRRPESFPGT